MISNKEKVKAVLLQYSNVVEHDETLTIALVEYYFTVAAEQILSVLSMNSDTPPQLNKHDVSRSAGCYKADKKNWCLDERTDMSICQKCGRNVEYINKEQTSIGQCFG